MISINNTIFEGINRSLRTFVVIMHGLYPVYVCAGMMSCFILGGWFEARRQTETSSSLCSRFLPTHFFTLSGLWWQVYTSPARLTICPPFAWCVFLWRLRSGENHFLPQRARRNARDAMLSFVQNPNRYCINFALPLCNNALTPSLKSGSSNSKQAAQLLTRRKIKRNSRTSQISSHEFNVRMFLSQFLDGAYHKLIFEGTRCGVELLACDLYTSSTSKRSQGNTVACHKICHGVQVYFLLSACLISIVLTPICD